VPALLAFSAMQLVVPNDPVRFSAAPVEREGITDNDAAAHAGGRLMRELTIAATWGP
jgi:hypothetical protein